MRAKKPWAEEVERVEEMRDVNQGISRNQKSMKMCLCVKDIHPDLENFEEIYQAIGWYLG